MSLTRHGSSRAKAYDATPPGYPKHKSRRPRRGWLSHCVDLERLERAKGLEPSTPTLARSCSTTELHPHPRWRRWLAVNGRPMPNADRECNSPLTVRRHPDNLISSINGRESVRNRGQTGFLGLGSGTRGLHGVRRSDSSLFRPGPRTGPVNSPRQPASGHAPAPTSQRRLQVADGRSGAD